MGSSNSLSRRLEQYFNPNPLFYKEYGLLLPLIKKEGFSGFNLEVFVMPEELSSDYNFLFLEQYNLLDSNFNLNTQRVVNFRVNQGNTVYLYDFEGKILYYTATSLNVLKADGGIHILCHILPHYKNRTLAELVLQFPLLSCTILPLILHSF